MYPHPSPTPHLLERRADLSVSTAAGLPPRGGLERGRQVTSSRRDKPEQELRTRTEGKDLTMREACPDRKRICSVLFFETGSLYVFM